ncbi:hypothetical protein LCGC14_1770040 [marine sediment metagenome]|uniref:Uncharacterized protein n=1 Tax=marine sediment metagenome TaxID=412755 RepID=A0A0F9GYI8_9ZZZZ
MKIGEKKDDRDVLLLALNRLSHRDLGRFVLITETEKKDHFGTVYSDNLEDAVELLDKAIGIMADAVSGKIEIDPLALDPLRSGR